MNAGEHKDYRIFVAHALVSQAVSSAKKDIITGNLSETKFKLLHLTAWVYQTDRIYTSILLYFHASSLSSCPFTKNTAIDHTQPPGDMVPCHLGVNNGNGNNMIYLEHSTGSIYECFRKPFDKVTDW